MDDREMVHALAKWGECDDMVAQFRADISRDRDVQGCYLELVEIALRALDERDVSRRWIDTFQPECDARGLVIERLQARLDAVEMLIQEVATQDCTRGGFPVRLVTLARKWIEEGNDDN